MERPQDDLCGFAVGARIGAAFLPSKDPVATLLATFTELALGFDRVGPCSGVGEAREGTSDLFPGGGCPVGRRPRPVFIGALGGGHGGGPGQHRGPFAAGLQ